MHLIRSTNPAGVSLFYAGGNMWTRDIKQAQPYADQADAEKAIAMTQPFKGLVKLGHKVVATEIRVARKTPV